jgi:hypothetical protein
MLCDHVVSQASLRRGTASQEEDDAGRDPSFSRHDQDTQQSKIRVFEASLSSCYLKIFALVGWNQNVHPQPVYFVSFA